MKNIIYTATDRTPFTYYMKWSLTGISYYGCRYGEKCHPEQLGVSYLSSSTYVADYIKEFGLPDIIKVTKTFSTIEACRIWEARFLERTNAKSNKLLLNRANKNAYGKSLFKPTKPPANSGVKREIKLLENKIFKIPFLNIIKQNPTNKNRYHINFEHIFYLHFYEESDRTEFLKYNPSWDFGRNKNETSIKISNKHKGKPKPPRTLEHSKNISRSQKGISKPNSGPRKPADYQAKIDHKRETMRIKKLLKHKINLYFLDNIIRISTIDTMYDEYISQGWSSIKLEEDYHYIKIQKAKYLSDLYKGIKRPKSNSEQVKKNFSEGASRGHITRKENKLRKLNLAAL